jgi:hypothetical protein
MHSLNLEYNDDSNSCYSSFRVKLRIDADTNAELIEKTLKSLQNIIHLRNIIENEE